MVRRKVKQISNKKITMAMKKKKMKKDQERLLTLLNSSDKDYLKLTS